MSRIADKVRVVLEHLKIFFDIPFTSRMDRIKSNGSEQVSLGAYLKAKTAPNERFFCCIYAIWGQIQT